MKVITKGRHPYDMRLINGVWHRRRPWATKWKPIPKAKPKEMPSSSRPHHSALFYLLGAALFAGFAYVVCLL